MSCTRAPWASSSAKTTIGHGNMLIEDGNADEADMCDFSRKNQIWFLSRKLRRNREEIFSCMSLAEIDNVRHDVRDSDSVETITKSLLGASVGTLARLPKRIEMAQGSQIVPSRLPFAEED